MPIRVITFDWGETLAANYGMPYRATQRRAFGQLAEELRAAGCVVSGDWLVQVLGELEQAFRSSISPSDNPEHQKIDMRGMFDRWLAAAGGMDADAHRLELLHVLDGIVLIEPAEAGEAADDREAPAQRLER